MLVWTQRKVWALTRQENAMFWKKLFTWISSQNHSFQVIFSFRELLWLSGVKFCPKIKSWVWLSRSSPHGWKCKTNVSLDSKKSLSAYTSGKCNVLKKVVHMDFKSKSLISSYFQLQRVHMAVRSQILSQNQIVSMAF